MLSDATHPGSRSVPGAALARRLLVVARAEAFTLRAIVVSRIVVLVAGIAGALLLHTHAIASQAASSRAMGAVGHLLGATVNRFDAAYYLGIATTGYGRLSGGRVAFLPLYPELVRVVAVFTRSAVVAGALVSLVSFAIALVLLHRLTERELGRRAADATSLLLCFAPLSFFFSAIYAESLFLALSVGTFYAARDDRWRLACALAALATLTRPTGIVLVGPLLVLWHRGERSPGELGWLVLIPTALLAWMGTLALVGYGLGGQLHVEQAIWHRQLVFPLQGLALGVFGIVRGASYVIGGGTVYRPGIGGPFRPLFQDLLLGGLLITALVGLEGCRRRMSPEYFTYAGLALLMCLATPERGEPLWSFDRFSLTIFPLWMAAGALVAKRRLQFPVVLLGGAALVFYSMQVASWAFIA